MKHKILYLFVAVAMLSACNDNLEDSTFTISEEVPAATWLKENGYSQWVSLLEYTNLYSTINLNAGDYTLFVPNNEAVNAYLSENNYPSVSSINMDYAKLLVKYHTIAGNQYSQVDFTNDVLPDTTATGDRLTVTFDDNGDYFVNTEAKITNFDIATTNATLFIIDKMLSPVTEYIYDRLENDAEWSLFKELLEATALDSLVKQPESGKASQYTLFVVPNSVFGAANISNLSALADTLNAGQDREAWKATDNAMYRYAAYHFLSGAYSTNDFVKVDTTSTSSQVLILETLSEADFLEFQSIESNFYINYDTASMTGVQFMETTNLLCKNGMIHTVDAPMYIKAPSTIPATTWELTDYDVLAREIPEYRLSSLTSALDYPLGDLLEKYGASFPYQWETVASHFSPVSYYVGTSTDSIGKYFMNHDALNINLGQYGYVEMESPTIVADSTTYYVGLSFYNTFGSAPGNRITIYLDDEPVGTMYTSGGKAPSRFKKDPKPEEWIAIPKVDQKKPENNEYIVGEVTFETTGKHKLRIEDNQGGDIYLDYILFTPKK